MKIKHRVSFHPKHHPKVKKHFLQLGIELKESFMHGDPKYSLGCHFDMYEDDLLWPEVEKILSSAGILTLPNTEFTTEEILSAKWVLIYPSHFWGYPMPDLAWEWKERSYTPEQECEHCGVGLCQKAPIHLKGEPKLGRNHFMGIFWTYDIFARNEVFDILSQNGITGFEAYPAIHYKKKVPLTTIKQLKVTGELAAGVINDNLHRENYPCGHGKYLGLSRGMYRFSRNIFKDTPDLIKTHEWFGGGHSATQFVLASAKFVRLYLDKGWRGLSLSPVELV